MDRRLRVNATFNPALYGATDDPLHV